MKNFHVIIVLLTLLISACPLEDQVMDGAYFLKVVADIEEMDISKRFDVAESLFRAVETVGTPLYVNDTTAILVVHSDNDSLLLQGDMNLWQAEPVFKRIPGTNLQYFVGEYESNARLQYWFQADPKTWPERDPLNPYLVTNGFGKMSELAMPGYEYDSIFVPFRDGRKSSEEGLDSHIIPPGILPYEHTIHVWVPPDLGEQKAAGSIYFLDGLGYITYAHMPTALNALNQDGKIPTLIAVFVTPPNYEKAGEPNRETEYAMNPDFVSFLADELVPFINSKYLVETNAQSRLVTGDSYGGLAAHYIGYSRPDVFGLAYSQSGYVSFRGDSLINLFKDSDKLQLKLALDCGTYETQIGGSVSSEADFTAANRRLKMILEAKGYDIHYREYPEGHTWGNWRKHLVDILPWFFGSNTMDQN